jgi:hypothetical protein
MARQREIVAVYAAGLVQGVALVTFPAASSILTSPEYYGLSSTAYGGLFLPQALAAIAAAEPGGSPQRTRHEEEPHDIAGQGRHRHRW